MRTLRSVAWVVMSMLLMVALGAAQAPADRPNSPQNRRVSTLGDGPWEFDTADYRIRVVKMIPDLDRPWGMTWLPDGTMLLTERPGRLRIVRNGLLDPQPISGVPTVLFKDFDGLEDVKVHPRYAENHLIYLSYSKPHAADGGGQCALARARYDGGHELKDVQDIFVGRGTSPRHLQQIVTVRMAWGLDGTIYMTCATPNVDRFQAQDPTSHRGKVLRMSDDGSAPPDNPLNRQDRLRTPLSRRDLYDRPSRRDVDHRASRHRRGLADGERAAGRRRAEHPEARQELRVAADLAGTRVQRRADQPLHGRHGAAIHVLGAVDRAVERDVLHRRQVRQVEGQSPRQRPGGLTDRAPGVQPGTACRPGRPAATRNSCSGS